MAHAYLVLKRIIDFLLSIAAVIVLWPFFLIIAIVIKTESRGPVFFMQKHVGKDKRHFLIFKFRTMLSETPKDMPTHLLRNPDAFITRSGKFLRKTSIDELPQIFNILKGDMSIIGPRPALWNQYDLISERDLYGANALLPGLTGWAQVNGRDELSIDEKARYDGDYAQRIGFLFDVFIFFKTLYRVVKREGVKEGMNIVKPPESKDGMNDSDPV